MKWIEKLHKKALTAAVCLALSASTAFAMPSGGNVISGGVDGIVYGTVASGGTLTVTDGNSVINWDAFGILSGETLNVNTAGGALLNRVTGAGVSELMGILNQTGANQMLIINPNGIVVGNGAQINATNLVLSTLDVTDGYSFTGSKNNVIGSFVTPSGKEKAAVKINGGTIKVGDAFKVFGGTIEIADGVQIAPATSVSDINDIKANTSMFAANAVTISSERSEFEADPSNTLSFEGVAAGTNLYLNGGKIDIFGGKPDQARDGEGDLGKFRVVAGNQFKDGLVYATPENKVTIGKADGSNNVNIEAKNVIVMGGAVDINANTDLYAGNVTVLAGEKIAHSPNADGQNAVKSASADNAINITSAGLVSQGAENGVVAVRGGAVDMKDAMISAPTTWITGATSSGSKSGNNTTANKVTMDSTTEFRSAGKIYVAGGKVDIADGVIPAGADATVVSGKSINYQNGKLTASGTAVDPTPEPTPDPTPDTPDTPKPVLSEDDKKNIDAGGDSMNVIIENNASAEAKQAATIDFVEKLNDANGTDRAKAAQFSGAMQAIKESDLDEAEKSELMTAATQAFTPTRVAQDTTKNTVASSQEATSEKSKSETSDVVAASTETAITGSDINEEPVIVE